MSRIKVDKIDRQILSDLQRTGRMTNVQLAQRAGISAPPCLRRVRALEEAQIIRGYHADLDAESLGFGVTVFAQVGLSSQAEADLLAFEELVESWPHVRECYMLAGETDFLLKGRCCRLGQLQQIFDVRTDSGGKCQPRKVSPGDPAIKNRIRRANRCA